MAGTTTDSSALIEAWRTRGDDRLHPVRFRLIEALARRSTAHHGEVRCILDARLHRLVEAYGKDIDNIRRVEDGDARQTPVAQVVPPHGALTGLVDLLARRAAAREDGPASREAMLGYVRSTWSKLSAERRLTQSLATVPQNAGPLNSHHLVHRALALMGELSPAYLGRFMAHVDALLWLDKAAGGQTVAGSTHASRGESPKKSSRGKARS